MTPTREDFAELSPADFMDKVEAEAAERRRAVEDTDWEARARSRDKRRLRRIWVLAIIAALIAFAGIVVWHRPAGAHDKAAWSDPARDEWYRSLKVPGRGMSCCDLTDRTQIAPEKVRQRGTAWYVDLGSGFVPVPPERVVTAPVSIDGMPYLFMMAVPTTDSPNGIRCFIPPVGTY